MPGKKKIRILLAAEDPAFLYKLTGKITSGKDMMIAAAAHSWRGAVKKSAQAEPDVLVLEFNMPGLPQVKAILRADPKARFVLLARGGKAGPDLRKAVEAGAQCVLPRSVPRRKLLQCIRGVHRGEFCLPLWARSISRQRALPRPRPTRKAAVKRLRLGKRKARLQSPLAAGRRFGKRKPR